MLPNIRQPNQPKTFAPRRPGRWLVGLLQYRYAVVIVFVFLLALSQKALATEFKSAADCVVGKRVVTREKQTGVIIKADGSSCHVKLDATGKTDYNIFWMLRAEASSGPPAAGMATKANETRKPQAAGGESSLATGKYACYSLAGSTLNYAFIDIHIESENRYRDKSGKPGTFAVDSIQKITFTGPLASANAKLLPGQRIGLNMDGGSFFNTTCSQSR